MKKTAAQIAEEVMVKIGATFYRGMGDPYVENVLREGLGKRHSVTTALSVAEEYAGKGATNILEGNVYKKNIPRRTQEYIKTMEHLGISPRFSRLRAPLNLPPRGAVIKLNIPDKFIPEYLGKKGLSGLGEYVVTKKIAPKNISVLSRGFSPGGAGMFPASMRRLTKQQLRLLRIALKQNKEIEAAQLVTKMPESYNLNVTKRMTDVRTGRRQLTSMLKKLLSRGR
jgi:hypothetical protein